MKIERTTSTFTVQGTEAERQALEYFLDAAAAFMADLADSKDDREALALAEELLEALS